MKLHEEAMEQPDRLRCLLSAFAAAGRSQDGRPTTEQLKSSTGVAPGILRPGYPSRRSAATVERIADAAAQLLAGAGILSAAQAARLPEWLHGAADPELQQLLELQARIVRCNGPGPCAPSAADLSAGWFDPQADADRWNEDLRLCSRCMRARRSEAGVKSVGWEEDLAEQLPQVKVPDRIRRAFYKLRAAGKAIKYTSWADEAGVEVPELRRTLTQAGVQEKPRGGRFRPSRWAELLILLGPPTAYVSGVMLPPWT